MDQEDVSLVLRSYSGVIGLVVESEETQVPVFEINGVLTLESSSQGADDYLKAKIVNNKIVLYNEKGLEIPRD